MYSTKFEGIEHPLLLNARDAARLLSISERTLWGLTHRSENPLPYIRIGRCLRYLLSDVHAWIESQRSGWGLVQEEKESQHEQ